jgi:hypothetical protein
MKLDPQPGAGVVDSQSVKSSAEARGYDGGKKVDGRKRHILVDTYGFVLKAKVPNSAKVMDFERGSRPYCAAGRYAPSAPLSPVVGCWLPWRGKRQGLGTEKALGWSLDLLERARKVAPKDVLMGWASEGVQVDWHKLLAP